MAFTSNLVVSRQLTLLVRTLGYDIIECTVQTSHYHTYYTERAAVSHVIWEHVPRPSPTLSTVFMHSSCSLPVVYFIALCTQYSSQFYHNRTHEYTL